MLQTFPNTLDICFFSFLSLLYLIHLISCILPPPPTPLLYHPSFLPTLLLVPFELKIRTLKSKKRQKNNLKKTQKTTMESILFWPIAPVHRAKNWNVCYILSDTPIKRMDFLFPRRYKLQIASTFG